MDHITRYYKNLSEQLQQQVKVLVEKVNIAQTNKLLKETYGGGIPGFDFEMPFPKNGNRTRLPRQVGPDPDLGPLPERVGGRTPKPNQTIPPRPTPPTPPNPRIPNWTPSPPSPKPNGPTPDWTIPELTPPDETTPNLVEPEPKPETTPSPYKTPTTPKTNMPDERKGSPSLSPLLLSIPVAGKFGQLGAQQNVGADILRDLNAAYQAPGSRWKPSTPEDSPDFDAKNVGRGLQKMDSTNLKATKSSSNAFGIPPYPFEHQQKDWQNMVGRSEFYHNRQSGDYFVQSDDGSWKGGNIRGPMTNQGQGMLDSMNRDNQTAREKVQRIQAETIRQRSQPKEEPGIMDRVGDAALATYNAAGDLGRSLLGWSWHDAPTTARDSNLNQKRSK